MSTPLNRLGLSEHGSALNDVSNRRNPRRGAAPNFKEMDGNVSSDSEDDDDIDQKPTPIKSRNAEKRKADDDAAYVARRSRRSTKFQASLKEPSVEYIQDLYDTDNSSPSTKSKSNPSANSFGEIPKNASHAKSPAASHKAVRRQIKIQVPVSDDEESESEGDQEDMETNEEELKIQRIIAARSERRKDWKRICLKMNTSEIASGSRWFEDENDQSKEYDDDTFEERFLVKWDDLSYLHCSWETQKDLVEQLENAKKYLSTFFRKSSNGFLFSTDERCDGDFFDPSYTQVERILEVVLPEKDTADNNFGIIMDKFNPGYHEGTGRQFLVKWGSIPYSECTYEFERDLLMNDVEYEDQVEAFYRRSKKPSKVDAKAFAAEGEREFRSLYMVFGDASKLNDQKLNEGIAAYQKNLLDAEFPNGGQLRDYQAEGVSWMISNYLNGRSCLLADEMGLGKTLQTCSFINILATKLNRIGPFLVVAPLSTLEHWKREFESWTTLNTVIYHGTAKNREQIRELEFAYEQDRPPRGSVAFNASFLKKCHRDSKSKFEKLWMVQVVVTTPEMICTDDFSELTAIEWDALVVDEAHRLKSHSSKLAVNLRDPRFVFHHTLLLTGTPIQNNMTELWALLNIIDPSKFDDLDAFLEVYGSIKSKQGIDQLHESIRPYILRRLKEDVEKSVPPKEETLIEVELTTIQKQYYRALYEKNVQFLHRNKKKPLDGPSLNNLAMQLRKCCNHVFLLNGVEQEIREQEKKAGSSLSEADFLVKCSGKVVLLDKLLPRLKVNGHRVLLFSQFKIMLDIIEDYLHARNFKAERIDGSITGKKRQMAIDRFQSPDTDGKEPPFIMMLSTRAGGVGINLTAADTCIIFDSDWNPQNDLQAQARCHRIGQTKSVKVYRLLTRKTYEMQMFHLSSMKMGLDQAVLHGFENGKRDGEGTLTKDEIEKLLRHGAYDIFNEDKSGTADSESKTFVEQDIDWILERRARTVVHENTGTASSAAGGTFSKASFKAIVNPESSNGETGGNQVDVDIDDPEFWTKIIGAPKQDDEFLDAGKKRKRNEANYSESQYSRQFSEQIDLSDSEVSESDEIREEDFGDDDVSDSSATPNKKRKREFSKWGRKHSQGWKRPDAEKLVKTLSAYGYGLISMEELRKRADLAEYDFDEIEHMSWAIILCTLREVAGEGVIATQRRAERAFQKRKENGEKKGDRNSDDLSGGVLGMDRTHLTGDSEATKHLEDQLRILVECNQCWLSDVFQHAKAFGIAHESRSEGSPGCYGTMEGQKKQNASEGNALFAQNLFPQLKSRGWKVEQVNTDGKVDVNYLYGGETYKSPESVMTAVSSIHPELNPVVEEIRLSLAAKVRRDEEEKAVHLSRLEVSKIDVASLERHINRFAPLQLIVDRATTRRLNLTKKILSSCSVMYNAHDIVRQAESSSLMGTVLQKISHSLILDKRIYLPHPEWSSKHDAVLIHAIAKHGWIDSDACFRSITEDKTIAWGPPFDCVGGVSTKETTLEGHGKVIMTVATRAIQFLTSERDVLDALKDFKEAALINTYNLRKMPTTAELGPIAWEIDKSRFGHGVQLNSLVIPSKKELVKRAKLILSKRILLTYLPVQPEEPAQKADHGYCVLNQGDPANILLAEILRALLKVSFSSSGQRRQMGRRLMNAAVNEAKCRISDLEMALDKDCTAVSEMAQIVDHCMLAIRNMQAMPVQAKNVLRAVLGLPLIMSRGASSPFPPVALAIEKKSTGNRENNSNEPRRMRRSREIRSKGASGDIAISDSMAAAVLHSDEKQDLDASWLKLSYPETLLLTVACSQGLPVWTEHWFDLIDSSNLVPEKQGPGFQNAISWWGMGEVLAAAAKVWHHTTLKKLESQKALFVSKFLNLLPDTDVSKVEAKSAIDALVLDESCKRKALAIAGDYKNNPEKLAKKCIMLLGSLLNHMGPIDSIVGKNQARVAKLQKTENGLGPFVLEWLSDEIRRWAESLSLVDDNGQPFCLIESDFNSPEETDLHEVAALMNSRCCRAVFAQIAQQSRVREVFLANSEKDVKSMLRTAAQEFAPLCEWEHAPSWWGGTSDTYAYSGEYDFLVLASLLEFGYSGIEQTLAVFDDQVALHHQGSSEGTLLSRASIQFRANQLARALHVLNRSRSALSVVRNDLEVCRKTMQAGTESPDESYERLDSNVLEIEETVKAHLVGEAKKRVDFPCNNVC